MYTTLSPYLSLIYCTLAEGPGVARGKKKLLKKCWKFCCCCLKHPPATHECSQKISAHSVQPFGRLKATYIYANVLFYYIEDNVCTSRYSEGDTLNVNCTAEDTKPPVNLTWYINSTPVCTLYWRAVDEKKQVLKSI